MNNNVSVPGTNPTSMVPFTYAENKIPFSWSKDDVQLLINGPDLIIQTSNGEQIILMLGAELASLHDGLFRLIFSDGKVLDSSEIITQAKIQSTAPERDKAPESLNPEALQEGNIVVKEVVVEDIITIDSKGGGATEQQDDSTYVQLDATVETTLTKNQVVDDSIPVIKKSSGSPPVEQQIQNSNIPTPGEPTEPTIVYPKVTLLQVSSWRDPVAHRYQVGTGSEEARTDGSIKQQYQSTRIDLSNESANWTIDVQNTAYFADGMVSRIIRFDEAMGQVTLSGLPAGYQMITGGTAEGNRYGLLPGEIMLIYPQSQYDTFTANVSFTDAEGNIKQQKMTFSVVDNPTSLIDSKGQIQLAASPNDVSVIGGTGDDFIIAGKGNDSYDGGAGSNTVDFSKITVGITVNLTEGTVTGGGQYSLSNIQNIIGTDYDDVLIGNHQNNHLQGGLGNDTLIGGGGNNILDGGEGVNTLSYQHANSAVSVDLSLNQATNNGEGGTDQITNIQNVIGSQHNDRIVGNGSDNYLSGGDGDDVLIGMGGNNTLDGGTGINTASYENSTSGIQADLITKMVSNGFGGTDTLINIQDIIGSSFNDRIVSGNGSSSIHAGAGNDIIIVGGNASSRAILDGGEGDDLFIAGYGYNAFIGGGGIDTVDYSHALTGINISMKDNRAYVNGFGGIDQFDGITGIIGSEFDDRIELGANDAIIHAGAGNDLIIAGGSGTNLIDGGSGINTLDYSNAASGIDLSLQQGKARQNGFGGQDTIANIQNLVGSGWNDTIEGDDHDNNISAGAGDDWVYGSKGNDVIDGGKGSNTLDYSRLSEGVTVNMVQGTVQKGINGSDSFTSFDSFIGTEQDDSFLITTEVASIDGGAGFDSVDFGTIGGSFIVDLSSGTVVGRNGTNQNMGTIRLNGIEKVIISSGVGSHFIGHMTESNEFVGSAGNDIFRANGGNNVITGGGGADWVEYISATQGVNVNLNQNGIGLGVSSDNGFGGQDILNGITHLRGSSFDDVLTGSHYLDGGRGNDVLVGDNGATAYAYYGSVSSGRGVVVDLAAGITSEDGYGTQDTLSGIRNVIGSSNNDTVYGDNSNNIIRLGAGDDYMYGSQGNDALYGEAGTDTIDYSLLNAAVNVDLSTGKANKGANGTDTLSSFENITGTQYADVLKGDNGSNVIRGGGGDDILIGLGGNDTLIGGDGFVTADYSLSPDGIIANLSNGQVQDGHGSLDTLISISKITGSGKDDIFQITNNLDLHQYTLDGGAGNDVIKKSGAGGLFTIGDSNFHIANIEKLDFADGKNDTLNVDLSGLFNGYSSNASINLNTDAGDTVNISPGGGWSLTASGSGHETWSHGEQSFTWSWA
ncbi:hypothetical protein SOASR032_08330 [Pragia fontium]|uniref:Cyclolysin n=1 Tax=Pragia fontium TaxID=82985 RepID=A0ABQ5LFU9_9GAMM|nr:hypothetical protein [Pragia fontium]GKX62264.1 hypothetical protein SOASR032_08330 [Pragia fontium]